ncbi:hypothetical protein G6M86_29710 (plasmid) [Agrobacterium tumefaciens]|uniref:Uncharacterized protein n=1 Tax=Agrobacterium tumefaciens TaxID=358 RepID=A0AAJ4TDV6_AGRTU|nr:hypothetical protein G6M86_29710 [Agrobacterium tumefaciens]
MINDDLKNNLEKYFEAKKKFDDLNELPTMDYSRDREIIGKALALLSMVADSVRSMAETDASTTVIFEFRTEPELLPGDLATAILLKDGRYVVRMSIALIHLFYLHIRDIGNIPERSYDPSAIVLMAAVAAIAHEVAHILYGHLDTDPKSENHGSGADRALEADADRRGGGGMLSTFMSLTQRKLLAGDTGLKSKGEFLEAAFLGQIVLCAVIGTNPSERSKKYHGPSVRFACFSAGLSEMAARQDFLSRQAIIERLSAAGDIAASFISPKRPMLSSVLTAEEDDAKQFEEITCVLMSRIVPEKADLATVLRRRN